jgi:phosphohistidine phosphatase
MKIAFVRHAIAEAREAFVAAGNADELRPLTGRGRRKMYRAAAGLRLLLPSIDLLVSSPLLRAVATAEILAAHYDDLRVVQSAELAPGVATGDCLQWLQAQRGADTIVLVGHQPDLGLLVSYLLTDNLRPCIELKKGGACLLDCNELAPGRATLLWALRPSQLAALRGGAD